MSTNIKNAKKGSTIPAMKSDTYAAVCCSVIDLGIQLTNFEGREKETPQILIAFEFPDELIEYNGEMMPRQLSRIFTLSVNEKSGLRKILMSWRGRDFTEEELNDFDIKNIIGAPCMVSVVQTTKGGNTYANIAGVSKLLKGISVSPPRQPIHFDIDDRSTWDIFPKIPEWIKQKINNSITFKNAGIQISSDGTVISGETQIAPLSEQVQSIGTIGSDDDDDLPF